MGISRIAVFKKVKKGQLPAIRFGRNWAVSVSEINKALSLPAGRPAARAAKPLPARRTVVEKPAVPEEDAAASEMDSIGWD